MNEPASLDAQAYALRAADPATHRDALARSSPWYAEFLKEWLPFERDCRILDLPCGVGNLLFALQQQGYSNVLGVDMDPGQVQVARQLGLPAEEGDVFETLAREAAGTVARIFSLDFLEHMPREQAVEFCRACHRALKPGGKLICRTPSADGPFGSHDRYNDLTHRWGMTSGAAAQLFRLAGFSAEQLTVVGEAPVPYKLVNRFRLWLYRLTTAALGAYLELCGIGAPRIWTRSMWIIASRVELS
jgi:SAM-dependent methyltransferase